MRQIAYFQGNDRITTEKAQRTRTLCATIYEGRMRATELHADSYQVLANGVKLTKRVKV